MMLIFIVVVFVICHSIRSIINTFECIQLAMYGKLKHWPDWIQTLVHVNHFALVVNSSINILIYCSKDEKFLNVMLQTFGLKR
jgi:ABC-type proline/glycine betaine transport system permease subunit